MTYTESPEVKGAVEILTSAAERMEAGAAKGTPFDPNPQLAAVHNALVREASAIRTLLTDHAAALARAADHALVCWAMCVQDARWEEWSPGKGEFCFAGLRHVTTLDEHGAPILAPHLRAMLIQSRDGPSALLSTKNSET